MFLSIKSLTVLAIVATFVSSALSMPAPMAIPDALALPDADSTNTTASSIEKRQANACRCIAGNPFRYWLDLDNWGFAVEDASVRDAVDERRARRAARACPRQAMQIQPLSTGDR